MTWLTFKISREPGFRFNLLDLLLLLAAGGVSAILWSAEAGGGRHWLPLYVAGTFFLFCNVFRIGNRIEPFWYLAFLAVVLPTMDDPALMWWLILLVLEPLKAALILYCVRSGSYHGIFCRKR